MSIAQRFTPKEWQEIHKDAADWRTPHMHLTLALIRALSPKASSNAFVRLVKVSSSPIADPSIIVDLARCWNPRCRKAHATRFYANIRLANTNPLSRAFIYDFYDPAGSTCYQEICNSKLCVLQLYGITGSIKDALIEQWNDIGSRVFIDTFICESRIRRRALWIRRMGYLNKPTLRKDRYSDGLHVLGGFLYENKRWGNDVLISPKQVFDLFFDAMAAAKPNRRQEFIRRLSRRIHTDEFRCEANLVLVSQLREALKNDVKNLSLEEINRRFV